MISIIIPTFNASSFLPGLLTSLNGQTLEDREIIIVDSSSTDDTVGIARSFSAKTITPIITRLPSNSKDISISGWL